MTEGLESGELSWIWTVHGIQPRVTFVAIGLKGASGQPRILISRWEVGFGVSNLT